MVDPTAPVLTADDGAWRVADVRRAFLTAGIGAGDTVMVHSRLFTLGRFAHQFGKDEILDLFIDTLKEIVGHSGTLIFPTFSLSVCRTGVFDTDTTPSEMGILSERARRRSDSRRIAHPLYSVALIGNIDHRLMEARTDTSFGPGSLFDILHQINAPTTQQDTVKFMTIGMGVPTEGITYIHYIEELCGVPYRYHKAFTGSIRGRTDQPEPYTVDFFVRDLSTEVVFDQDALWELLRTTCPVGQARLGNATVAVLGERCVFATTKAAIERQSDFLCKGGYHPQPDTP